LVQKDVYFYFETQFTNNFTSIDETTTKVA